MGEVMSGTPFSLVERMAHAAREVAREGSEAADAAREPRVALHQSLIEHTVSPEAPSQIRAEFLPSAKLFFENCGLDSSRIDPIPIGEGYNHMVFAYHSPESVEKVIKIPKPETQGLMNKGRRDESENIHVITKYFSQFTVPTEIRSDPATGKYLIIQNVVEGDPITNKSQTPEIDVQLAELMRCNRRLMKDTGHSMDFVGVPGIVSWARHQFHQFFERTSVFEISNLILDTQGKIRIIDYDMLRFRNVSPRQGFISRLGFNVNRFIMKTYFGVDMKPKV